MLLHCKRSSPHVNKEKEQLSITVLNNLNLLAYKSK